MTTDSERFGGVKPGGTTVDASGAGAFATDCGGVRGEDGGTAMKPLVDDS
jgi:hypothetical protein